MSKPHDPVSTMLAGPVAVALAQTPATTRVLDALTNVKAHGSYWTARCPAHEDAVASLSVSIGRDGRVLLKCHAGCDAKAIVERVGLTMADLYPESSRPSTPAQRVPDGADAGERPVLTNTYDYVDPDGTLLFQSCRFVRPDGSKTFRQRHRDANGKWVWNLQGVTPVLYRLPEVLAAMESGNTIYVVEGEKDADNLAQHGYVATTNPMGAGKWSEAYSAILTGADVVILPDNDPPGKSHAQQVATSLTAVNCQVRVVELPGLPPKGDVSDWLADQSNDLDEFNELVYRTLSWVPDPKLRVRWTLREILADADAMKPPVAVVPRVAWESRSTLLASAEKSGKSTLTGYLAAQVSTGGHFLDARCQMGNVLILGLEEFRGDLARRLSQFGADPDRVSVVTRFLGEPADRLQEIRTHLAVTKPVLCVIDTLMAYASGAVDDAAKSAQMQPIVQSITDIAHETGVSIILVHHARKSDGKYRDSSSIGGAVDVIAEVFTPDEENDATLRRVNVRGRIPQTLPFDLRFDGDTYSIALSGEAPIELRIVEYVRSHPNCSANDVAEYLMGNRKKTLDAITRLLAGQHLLDTGATRGRKLTVPAATPARLFDDDRRIA